MKVPYLPRAGIARAAEELLERALGARADQVPIDLDALVFDYLCEHEGLVFVDDEILASGAQHDVLGRIDVLAGRISVCASLKVSDPRRFRFTVAHELGHWVLHRPLVLTDRAHPDLFPNGTVFVSTRASQSARVQGKPPEEWQADYFASHLLLPRRVLRREYTRRLGATPSVRPDGMTLEEYARQVARTRFAEHAPLADAFGTSLQATAIALEELGLVVSDPVLL